MFSKSGFLTKQFKKKNLSLLCIRFNSNHLIYDIFMLQQFSLYDSSSIEFPNLSYLIKTLWVVHYYNIMCFKIRNSNAYKKKSANLINFFFFNLQREQLVRNFKVKLQSKLSKNVAYSMQIIILILKGMWNRYIRKTILSETRFIWVTFMRLKLFQISNRFLIYMEHIKFIEPYTII